MFNLKVIIALMACSLAVQAVELDSWYTGYHHGGLKPVHTAGAVGRYHSFDQGHYFDDGIKDYGKEHGKHYDLSAKDKHIFAKDHLHDIDVGTKTYFIEIIKNAKDIKDVQYVKATKNPKNFNEIKVATDVKNTESVKDVKNDKVAKNIEVENITKNVKHLKVAKDVHDAKDVTTLKEVQVSSTVKPHAEQKPSIDIRSVKTTANHESIDYNVMKNHKELDYNPDHHHLTGLTAHKEVDHKFEAGKDVKIMVNVDKTIPTFNYALNGNKVEDGKHGIDDHHDFDHNIGHKDVKKYTDVHQVPIDHYSNSHKQSYGEYNPTPVHEDKFSFEETYHKGFKSPYVVSKYENVKSSHKLPSGNKHHYNHDKYDVSHNNEKKVLCHYEDNHGVKSIPYWSYEKHGHALDTDYYNHQNVELNGGKGYKAFVKKSYNYKY